MSLLLLQKKFNPRSLPNLQLWLPADRIGVQGYSLDFDGTDDSVQANNVITSYPFTLECWVRLDVTDASQGILAISNISAGNVRYGLFYSASTNNKFSLVSQNTTNIFNLGTTTPSANVWYHLAGVFESDTSRKLYVNGVEEAAGTDNVTFNNSANNRVNMGRHFFSSSFLNGKLSDVRVWNTVRTAQQIADNYNKRLIGNESGLVGYWKLDKGSGTTVADSTTNANAGTLNNGVLWDNNEPFTEPIDDGTAVRLWSDQSGNGYDATQATSAARPTYIASGLNGLPVVRFDGTDDRMGLVSSSLGMLRNVGGATIFAVVKYPANALGNISFSASVGTSSSARLSLVQDVSNKIQIAGRRLDADSFESAIQPGTITNIFVIHSGILNYSDAKAFNYINGALNGTDDPFQTVGNTSDTNSNNISIGASGVPSNHLNGDIAEIIVYNRALNTSELAQVHRYLARKWGIALA
jgi:hypothetical protein